ncbi:MAG: AI-2E family transporter [Acidobacteria bacterium]|nr:AI-2E family transporter [Acidobacteriota bacterium]MBI3424320.1 AI-2E family transporter [Acidobacteriota bacterium]
MREPPKSTGSTFGNPLEWLRWVPAMAVALLALLLLAICGGVIFLPMLCAIALAYLLAPYVKRFEQRGWSRANASVLCLILTGLLFALALIFILPNIWEQLGNAYQRALMLFTNREKAAPLLSKLKQTLPPLYSSYIDALGERLLASLNQYKFSELALGWFQSGIFQLFTLTASIFDLLLIPFFTYYLLADAPAIKSRFELLIPPRFRPQALALMNRISLVISSYIRGQLAIAAIMGSMYILGFALLRVPIAITLGVISGLLNFIPYIGTLTGLSLSLIFLVLDGAGLPRLLGILLLFAIVQSIEGYYLTPKILGHRLDLSPLWVLVGLLIGGNLFGLLGIVLALPVLAVAKVLLEFLEEIYQQSAFYSRTVSPLLTGDGLPVEPGSKFQASYLHPTSSDQESSPRIIITSSELASRLRDRPTDSEEKN